MMKKVTVNGINLAYTRCGRGMPLVLVHGYPLDHTIWDEVVPYLENDFELILPDLRGFGESDMVGSEYTINDMAGDILGLLDYLGMDRVCMAGHSMGGYLALAFARRWPDRLCGLALVASQALADSPERIQGRYESAIAVMRDGVGQVVEAMSPKLTPDARVQAYVRSLIAAQRPAGLAGALKAMAVRDDSMPFLSAFKFPVALVHGDADALVPVERAREIKNILPLSLLLELPGVGHMPMMEAARETSEALKYLV